MINKKIKKKLYKKMICAFIVTCFLTVLINQTTAYQQKLENTEQICYGFILSYLTFGNFTTIDQINCRIRHMINDILREKIQVYWTVENITVNITKIDSEFLIESRLFERGSFIIPFSGNLTDDKKIISIIYDYNQSSEIEINEEIKVPIYILLDQISSEVLPLNNVKIAQLYSRITSGDFLFLQLISKCGFLNSNILKDEDVYENLKLDDYNVMFHPGGTSDTLHLFLRMINQDIFYKCSDGIRSFVNNGGGYIGSCGGLTKASAGGKIIPSLPFTINLSRKVYNPNLRSIGLCAIADILIQPIFELNTSVQVKIIKNTSPLTFGLDEIVWDSWYGGPQVYKRGENVEVIANYYNTGTENDRTPAWLTTEFGSGKVVLFSTHPEITGVPFNVANESQLNVGKTVITNSLFYTTAEEKIEYHTHFSKNLDYIYEIFQKTAQLTDNITKIEKIFDSTRKEINNTKDYIKCLRGNVSEVISLIVDIASKNNINTTDKKYYLGLDYVKDIEKYYLDDFIKILNDSFIVFDKIELIHDLLKNDFNYTQQLELLLNNISSRINETNNILKKTQDTIECLKKDLLKYEIRLFRSIIKETVLKLKSNSLYTHVYSGFSQIPQIYQESLKFLRQHWYGYESNIIL
jgi:hypothetical protein